MTTRPDRGGDQPSRPSAVARSVPPIPAQGGTERTPDQPEAARSDPADVPPTVADPTVQDGPAPKPDRAQYGVCAFLALVGGLVIADATRIGHAVNSADPIGPKPVPILLGVLLLIVAGIYAVDVARGGAGEPEAGEDVDLTTPIDWRTVLLLIGAFLVNAVLIDRLGWVISGTLLFWGSAFALGNRHYVRNLSIAVALSLVTFYTFAIGLGVNLPAGVLQGIL
ncbi:putative tricarboxylic transport membrane protein [Micromonospora echinaurantiaca]|uniref:Putative tricarboxylic transport membrane protein n=1 Tax=Micromonospora echinaurantiaca TaxID=47857 RepID=A0A1C5K1B6_9ACTN|nr:tripartite tricarboxylate transporter TctB family protein [Micromonospora echinaurantiaca]SCG76557.1 putative tricarboxylic transport membrane protein [Micromonospora echinaurantiaca]